MVSYSAVDSIGLVFIHRSSFCVNHGILKCHRQYLTCLYSPQFILFKPRYIIVPLTVLDLFLFTAVHSV